MTTLTTQDQPALQVAIDQRPFSRMLTADLIEVVSDLNPERERDAKQYRDAIRALGAINEHAAPFKLTHLYGDKYMFLTEVASADRLQWLVDAMNAELEAAQ